MPTIHLPLDQMSVEEKLQLVETIWASIAEHPDELESPAWHKAVLRERERQVEAGEIRSLSWEEAQQEIDRLVALGSAKTAAERP